MITVRGEVDLANNDALLNRLIALVHPATGHIALDLANIDFIDCSGLRTLTALEHYIRVHGGCMRISAASPAVVRLLELAASTSVPAGRVLDVALSLR
jgi:anti-sigma B factor antagonist